MINGRWIFVPFYSFFRSLLPNNAVIFIFLGTRSDNPLFFHTPSTSFCQSIKDEKISQKSVLAPPKKLGPPCVMSSACETIIHYSPVWRVMCLTLLEITPLYGRSNLIFFPPFLSPSFIPGGIGSYYPSWNDFNRDTAIPRELSLPAATQSIANWTGPWFIENPLLRSNSRSTHTQTHTYTHSHKHTQSHRSQTGSYRQVAQWYMKLKISTE